MISLHVPFWLRNVQSHLSLFPTFRGEDAEKALEEEGLRVGYLQLDIEDEDSIQW